MAEKRLYKVRVETEFAVLAESEREAETWARIVGRAEDQAGNATATLLVSGDRVLMPLGWDRKCGVYGAPKGEHITLGAAIDAEQARAKTEG